MSNGWTSFDQPPIGLDEDSSKMDEEDENWQKIGSETPGVNLMVRFT